MIGPRFKNESKQLIKYIKEHQKELIDIIEQSDDLTWNDIQVRSIEKSNESLINQGFITLKKETQVKGEDKQRIITFDDFYLLVSSEVIS